MLGVMRLILDDDCESMSGDDDFFSVARTMPLVAASSGQRSWNAMRARSNVPLIPSEVTPWFTAFKAYSIHKLDTVCVNTVGLVVSPKRIPICTNFPLYKC
jgi:hypothetical protein